MAEAPNKALGGLGPETSPNAHVAVAPANVTVFEVFLSHRGPDVKKHFASFLYRDLERAGVTTFLDEEDLRPGDLAWETITSSLYNAKLVVVIVSKGFAKSDYCRKELVMAMKEQKPIIPVFYDVSTGLSEVMADIPVRDTEALRAFEHLRDVTGFRLDQTSGNVVDLAENVLKRVLDKLGRPPLAVARFPVDLDEVVNTIKADLLVKGIIALVGMGGIGKTALAMALYNSLSSDFVGSCCFVVVGKDGTDLTSLQEYIFKELTGMERKFQNVYAGVTALRKILETRKVLLIIDNIWTAEQIDNLLPYEKKGSIIVLTGRDSNVFGEAEVHINCHHVAYLSRDAALELFSRYTFGTFVPPDVHTAQAEGAVKACAGLPLSLVVLGRHLRGQAKEVWDQALARLQWGMSLSGGKANNQLWETLRLSYEDLQPEERSAFLDVACFLLDRPAWIALLVWGNCGPSSLDNLKSKALLDVNEDGSLTIHDQLRDMGRRIVTLEQQGSRVWDMAKQHDSVWKAPEKMETLWAGNGSIQLASSTLHMEKLRLFHVDTLALPIVHPSIIYLSLDRLDPVYIAQQLQPDMGQLRVLVLKACKRLRALPKVVGLTALQYLSMYECSGLMELPSLDDLAALQTLDLEWCSSLTVLPSLDGLAALQTLNLGWCSSLTELPSLDGLAALQTLNLSKCGSLRELPSLDGPAALQTLKLDSCSSLTELPSLDGLTTLQTLNLTCCSGLMKLHSLAGLAALQTMYLLHCSGLTKLPSLVGLAALRTLDLEGCNSLTELPSLADRVPLETLNLIQCSGLTVLPSLTGLASLQTLDLTECSGLTVLPSLAGLAALQTLILSCEGLTTAPNLSGCTKLTQVDMSVPSDLALPPDLGLLRGRLKQVHDHIGVQCDGCQASPIQGRRYRKIRKDFDYCGSCMDAFGSRGERFVQIQRLLWLKASEDVRM